MIEFKRKDGNNDDFEVDFEVYLKGFILENVDAYKTSFGKDPLRITSTSQSSSEKLSGLIIGKFGEISFIGFRPYKSLDENVLIFVDINQSEESESLPTTRDVYIRIVPQQLSWTNPFTIGAYISLLTQKLNSDGRLEAFLFSVDSGHDPMRTSISVAISALIGPHVDCSFTHDFTHHSISMVLQSYVDYLKEKHNETTVLLLKEQNSSSVTSAFVFPNELKITCEKYLIYFIQFLKDLGIRANSDLREAAGKVLFSVTPDDGIEALDKIREALAIYLNLPASPISYDESFAAMRLQQQIENLQHSQKMAARELQFTEKLLVAQSEIIREKNVTISQKDFTIEKQNRIIEKITSKSIMIDSLENKEEFEKIFEGLEVGESKWLKDNLGIKVNPAKSLKSMGGKLTGKDDGIISLNLDKQAEDE